MSYAKLPKRRPQRRWEYRARQWFWIFSGELSRRTISGFLVWLGSLPVAGIAVWLLHLVGLPALADETAEVGIAYAVAGLAWLGIVFFGVVAVSILSTGRRIREMGRWQDNRFIFHEPVTLDSVLAAPENSERMLRIVAGAAPKFSVVRCQLSNPTHSKLLQATLQSPFFRIKGWRNFIANKPWPTFAEGALNVAVKIGPQRELYLEWWMPPQSVPQQIQVKMLSFEIQVSGDPDTQKDFCLHVSQPSNDYDFYARP